MLLGGEPVRSRAVRAAAVYFIIAAVLLLYYAFVQLTGLGIPCVFHKLTGLDCPGCGNSRALIALSHFDVKGAVDHNLFIFPELAFVGYIAATVTARYIKTGKLSAKISHERLAWAFLALLVVWGVVRNII